MNKLIKIIKTFLVTALIEGVYLYSMSYYQTNEYNLLKCKFKNSIIKLYCIFLTVTLFFMYIIFKGNKDENKSK